MLKFKNMKHSFSFIFYFLFPCFVLSQSFGGQKKGILSKEEFTDLKEFLAENNLQIKDSIFIKYDFNKENCWNNLDSTNDENINKVKSAFQKQIFDFNNNHKDAIAYNFREPGNRVNKVKLWDDSIIIDDKLFLKQLLFNKKKQCGSSVLISKDGTFEMKMGDSHFNLLNIANKKSLPIKSK